jgi:5-(carboxyamino)imidazole ribonucleotide mutase
MPKGVPVATVAIDGARNAGLLAARILESMQQEMSAAVRASDERLRDDG